MTISAEYLHQTQAELAQARSEIAALQAHISQLTSHANREERLLSHIVQHNWDIFALVNAQGKVSYVSPAVSRIMGYKINEIIEQGIINLIHPDDLHYAGTMLQETLSVPSEKRTFEIRGKHKDGRWRWLEMTAVNHLENPDLHAVLVNCRDITDQKQAEEAQRQSENYLRSLLDSQTAFCMRVNVYGNISYCNNRYIQEFGWAESSFIGKPALNYIHPDDHETVLNAVFTCLTQIGIPIQVELRKPTQAGGFIWTIWEFIAVQGSDGTVQEVQCVGFDITRQKQAEAELQAMNDRLEQRVIERTKELERTTSRIEAIFNYSGDGIVLLNPEHGIQQANHVFEKLFNFTTDEYVGQKLESLFHPEDAATITANIESLLLTQGIRRMEIRGLQAGGTLFDADISIAPVRKTVNEITHLVCIIRDISQRKLAELALAEERNLLRTVIDALPDDIYVKDLRHRLVLNNLAYSRTVGIPNPSDLIGKTDSDLFPLHLAEKWLADEKQLIATQIPLVNQEEHQVDIQGKDTWSLMTKVPLRNLQGKIVGIVGVKHNITNYKMSQEALHESEKLLQKSQKILQTVLDTVPVRVFWKNRDSIYQGCNRLFAEDAGLELTSNVVGKKDCDLVWGETGTDLYQVDDALVINGEIEKLEYEKVLITTDGVERSVLINKLPLRDESDQVIGILGSYIDITDRKHAEQSLRESEERLRVLFETVPDALCLMTLEGNLIDVNSAALRMTGLSREELIGKNIKQLSLFNNPHFQAMTEEELLLTQEGGSRQIEYEVVGRDGVSTVIETVTHPIRLNDNLLQLTVIRDISGRRKAEEALKASEELYRTTITTMYEGIVLQSADGTIQLCNRSAEKILGLTTDQMMGRTSLDPRWRSVHEDGTPFPGSTHPAMVTLTTGKPQENVVMGVHKPDGTLTWILINAQPLIDPEQNLPYAAVITFADITNRKNSEAALERALQQERELGELKSRFVSMASHEFRTPLATILATTESLRLYRAKMEAAQIDSRLDKIRQQVFHMKDILDDVLQLARIQAGRVEFKPVYADLNALCHEIIEEFEGQPLNHNRIILSNAVSPTLMYYDVRLMRHIMSNLISNALKYSHGEKPIYISLEQDWLQVTLTVRDEGIGIPPNDQKHLFEPFHRATNVGTISGTGLGLSITKQAVELHNGTISVDSQVGTGTTFTVTFPTTTT